MLQKDLDYIESIIFEENKPRCLLDDELLFRTPEAAQARIDQYKSKSQELFTEIEKIYEEIKEKETEIIQTLKAQIESSQISSTNKNQLDIDIDEFESIISQNNEKINTSKKQYRRIKKDIERFENQLKTEEEKKKNSGNRIK